jgi:predicted transcriptional regulator
MDKVEVDDRTKGLIDRLAASLGQSPSEVVARAVSNMWQEKAGEDLSAPLTEEEIEWLDADLGTWPHEDPASSNPPTSHDEDD